MAIAFGAMLYAAQEVVSPRVKSRQHTYAGTAAHGMRFAVTASFAVAAPSPSPRAADLPLDISA